MARLADDFAAIRTRLRELRGGRPAFMPADADATRTEAPTSSISVTRAISVVASASLPCGPAKVG
jgi:hypothetical protein